MKRETVDKIVREFVPYWSKRLGIPEIEIWQYSRMWCSANVNIHYNKYYLGYNRKSLADLNKRTIYHILFHELGHLKYRATYKYCGKHYAEYIAETSAFKWMKKYYPEMYYKNLKDLKSFIAAMTLYKEEKQYYSQTFMNIKEYQEAIQ